MLFHLVVLSLLVPTICGAFVHPGLLHTEDDFIRMRTMVNASQEPWLSGWNTLTSSYRSQFGYNPPLFATISRPGNFFYMYDEAARAYQTALRWKITGDERYANQSLKILDGWAMTMTVLNGNADRFLASGIYGLQWANAAEIMRTYDKWPLANFTNFQQWMLNIFYRMNHDFLTNHNGAPLTNYWANWDLCNVAAMMSIGVLTDRQDIFDEAINYAMFGRGNGALNRLVYYLHDGNLGQYQESGRDEGHTTLGIALLSPFLQGVWNQGIDFFSWNNYALLAALEYISKSNLWDPVANNWYVYSMPFQTYVSGPNVNTVQYGIAGALGFARACWETMYNHYVNRLGMWAPYTVLQAARTRPEGDGGNGDQLGMGTLTMTLPPAAQGATVKVSARLHGGAIVLNWWGSCYASYYNVYRSINATMGWTRIVYNQTGLSTTYTDILQGLPKGVYYYYVTGIIHATGQETPASNVVFVSTKPMLQSQYLLTGMTQNSSNITLNINDSIASRNAWGSRGNLPFVNDITYNNTIALNGVNDYVTLPPNMVTNLSDFSICVWVKHLSPLKYWARVFDFGETTGRYMFLAVNPGQISYTITSFFGNSEQHVFVNQNMPINVWNHYCITQHGNLAYVYINGIAQGVNVNLPFQPWRLGHVNITMNYLGKSQYGNDPYLNAQLYDFRIYHGDIGAPAVYEMATGKQAGQPPVPPTSINATQVLSNVTTANGNVTTVTYTFTNTLSWNVVPNATYEIMKSTNCGPFVIIAALLTTPAYNDIVKNGTYYQYEIIARNQAGDGIPSQNVTVIPLWPGDATPICVTVPPTTPVPTTVAPTTAPTVAGPTTAAPTNVAPTTALPTSPTTATPTDATPATDAPTTPTTALTTLIPTTPSNTTNSKISAANHVDMSCVMILLVCVVGVLY